MKIVWLNDFRLKQGKEDNGVDLHGGGAEATIDLFMQEGKRRGHDIKILTPQTYNKEDIEKAELIILSNTKMSLKRTQFHPADIDWIVENKKFIKLEHDATFCIFRNVQCDDLCEVIECSPFWHRKMFRKSSMNVFLSPLQLNLHKKFFKKELSDDKTVCVPPCIKKSIFAPSPTAVIKGTYCVIGAIYGGKGIEDILDQYEELGKNLRFIGKISDPKLANKIVQAGHTIVPPVPYEDMPKIIQKYEYCIISRRIKKQNNRGEYLVREDGSQIFNYMNEAYSRIIMEAYNCGLKILIDKESKKRVGRYSYDLDDEEMSKMCDTSDASFFDELEKRGLVK